MNTIEGNGDEEQGPDEADQARTGISPTLADKLRAFEARVRMAEEQTDGVSDDEEWIPQHADAPVSASADFVPKVFLEADKRAFLDKAQEWLSGPKRTEYLALLTVDWGMDPDTESPVNLSKSQRMIHRNLPVFDQEGEALKSVVIQILTQERLMLAAINLFHWFWLVREFPWLASELSDGERNILEKLHEAFHAIISQHQDIGKLFLQYALTGADLVLQFSVHDFLARDSNTSAARPPELTANLLNISDIQNLAGKRVLDLGCGLSLFASMLRQQGAEAYTLDFLSITELMKSARKRFLRNAQEYLKEHLGVFGTDETRRFHRKGSASRIPELFGQDFFDYIFACQSIIHPRRHESIKEKPDVFRREILGALRGLSPERGELRCSITTTFLTPAMMEKALLPLFVELLERKFEIVGMHDGNGDISFEKFAQAAARDAVLAGKSPVMQIRHHPVSDC